MFGLQLITGPAVEPVSLAMAKQHLLVDAGNTQDDALISAYISAARQYCEKQTHRAFFDQTWCLALDHFPIGWVGQGTVGPQEFGNWYYGDWFFKGLTIQLPYSQVQSVASITYADQFGLPQTLAPSAYTLDTITEPARITPVYGTYWPITAMYVPGNVRVTYVAGSYGDGVEVNTCPQVIVLAILMLVAHWYQNREASAAQSLSEIPLGVNALLDTVTIPTFGLTL